jgi:regulator of protease activity HflC (stomatin/prohibitin superfamily)
LLYIIVLVVFLILAAAGAVFFRPLVGAIILGVLVLVSVVWSVTLVDTTDVGVIKVFGETEQSELAPGPHLVAPWKSVVRHTALPQTFDYDGEVVASDGNPLKVTVGFTTKLNSAMAWKLQSVLGQDFYQNIVVPAGQTASRRGIAKFGWAAAATSERSAVEATILDEFHKVVLEQFTNAGISKEETALAFSIFPVQLRKALPDDKVLNAVAEKTASDQDLERQGTINEIAKKESERRETEGEGIKKLFDKLPANFTAAEISHVLGAIANKTRAEAMLKAVESGQVDTIIMNGDTAGGVANSMSKPAPAEKQ